MDHLSANFGVLRCGSLYEPCWPIWTTSSSRPTISKWGKRSKRASLPPTCCTRFVMSRGGCALGAPKVSGRGMGLDPNTVAEYLDNTLPGERVPDFEKVCLESDVHLAEVASCHQILTLVLGEPAEVDPALRRRMYEIVSESARAEARTAASAAAVATPVMAGAGGPSSEAAPSPAKPRPEVPDYLRGGSRSRFWPVAWRRCWRFACWRRRRLGLRPLDSNNPVIRWFYGGSNRAGILPRTPAETGQERRQAERNRWAGKSVDNASKTPGADAKLPENAARMEPKLQRLQEQPRRPRRG